MYDVTGLAEITVVCKASADAVAFNGEVTFIAVDTTDERNRGRTFRIIAVACIPLFRSVNS